MKPEVVYGYRKEFSREFKAEAVKLVKDPGVSVAQAARNLDIHENVLRKWIREHADDDAPSGTAVPRVAVTVWPESHLISKPSEHQRWSLLGTSTLPSCNRLNCLRRGVLGSSGWTMDQRLSLTTAIFIVLSKGRAYSCLSFRRFCNFVLMHLDEHEVRDDLSTLQLIDLLKPSVIFGAGCC